MVELVKKVTTTIGQITIKLNVPIGGGGSSSISPNLITDSISVQTGGGGSSSISPNLIATSVSHS
jgi:hypothetical protein